jgi:hypothetical protein
MFTESLGVLWNLWVGSLNVSRTYPSFFVSARSRVLPSNEASK